MLECELRESSEEPALVPAWFTIDTNPLHARSPSPRELDAARLSTRALLSLFPTRVALVADGRACVVLPEVPAIGIVAELAAAWERLVRGASSAELHGLRLRPTGEVVELRHTRDGGGCHVEVPQLVDAARRWVGQAFTAVEERHPALRDNGAYRAVQASVWRTWWRSVR